MRRRSFRSAKIKVKKIICQTSHTEGGFLLRELITNTNHVSLLYIKILFVLRRVAIITQWDYEPIIASFAMYRHHVAANSCFIIAILVCAYSCYTTVVFTPICKPRLVPLRQWSWSTWTPF